MEIDHGCYKALLLPGKVEVQPETTDNMHTKNTESSMKGRLPLSKSENMLEPKYKMKIVVCGHILRHSRPPSDDLVVNILAWYKKILTFCSL